MDDYDTPWKTALTRWFPDFLAFYFPAAHAAIDWAQPYAFLDAELEAIARDGELHRRVADKLVRLHTLAGGEQWVLVHIEVQGQRDAGLAERIFTYNYRTFDCYRRPVASLAVLADAAPRWRPRQFAYAVLGCRMRFEFEVAKLLDFAAVDPAAERNPFALLTHAHLHTPRARGGRRRPGWRQNGA